MGTPSDGKKTVGSGAGLESGTLHEGHGLDWKQPAPEKKKKAQKEEVAEKAKADDDDDDDDAFDWGAPVSASVGGGGGAASSALDLDWSQPVGWFPPPSA